MNERPNEKIERMKNIKKRRRWNEIHKEREGERKREKESMWLRIKERKMIISTCRKKKDWKRDKERQIYLEKPNSNSIIKKDGLIDERTFKKVNEWHQGSIIYSETKMNERQ